MEGFFHLVLKIKNGGRKTLKNYVEDIKKNKKKSIYLNKCFFFRGYNFALFLDKNL
jgi:hypothetical protein